MPSCVIAPVLVGGQHKQKLCSCLIQKLLCTTWLLLTHSPLCFASHLNTFRFTTSHRNTKQTLASKTRCACIQNAGSGRQGLHHDLRSAPHCAICQKTKTKKPTDAHDDMDMFCYILCSEETWNRHFVRSDTVMHHSVTHFICVSQKHKTLCSVLLPLLLQSSNISSQVIIFLQLSFCRLFCNHKGVFFSHTVTVVLSTVICSFPHIVSCHFIRETSLNIFDFFLHFKYYYFLSHGFPPLICVFWYIYCWGSNMDFCTKKCSKISRTCWTQDRYRLITEEIT